MEASGYVEPWLRPWVLFGTRSVATAEVEADGSTRYLPLGAMNTPELAQRVVEDHNASLEGDEGVDSLLLYSEELLRREADRGRVDIYFDAAKDSAGWHTPETP